MRKSERYRVLKPAGYLEDLICRALLRYPSDKVILPEIAKISGREVLEAGCGEGTYTKLLLAQGNKVTGIDKNPDMCRAGIKVHDMDAAGFAGRFTGKYDVVFSAWMTEYLNAAGLEGFFRSAYDALKPGGVFITTLIASQGLGKIYIDLARKLRGVEKYCYLPGGTTDEAKKCGFTTVRVKHMHSRIGIPWAYLLIGLKP